MTIADKAIALAAELRVNGVNYVTIERAIKQAMEEGRAEALNLLTNDCRTLLISLDRYEEKLHEARGEGWADAIKRLAIVKEECYLMGFSDALKRSVKEIWKWEITEGKSTLDSRMRALQPSKL